MMYCGGLKSRKIVALIGVSIIFLLSLSVAIAQIESDQFSQRKNQGNSDVSPEMKTVSLSFYSDIQDWDGVEWTLDEGTLTACISKQTGVLINTENPVQDADMQLSLMLMENKLPDIIAVSDSNMIRQLVSSGKVWNLEDFFSEYRPDAKILESLSAEDKQAMVYRDGGWYSIPTGFTSADLKTGGNAVIWNTDLLQTLGYTLSDVNAEEKVTEIFEAAKNYKEERIIPLLLGGEDTGGGIRFLAESFGGTPVNEDGSYQDIWRTEGGREALLFTNQLLRNGVLDATTLSYSSSQIYHKLLQNQVLCYIGNITDYRLDRNKWQNGGLIKATSGATPYLEMQTAGGYQWTNVFVSKSCTDLSGTAAFLDYMISGQAFDDYDHEKILEDWWILKNPLWEEKTSIDLSLFAVDKMRKDAKQIDGKNLVVPLYHFRESENFEDLKGRITDCEKQRISYVIAAESASDFEARFIEFQEELSGVGVEEYERDMTEQVEKNCGCLAGVLCGGEME